MSPAAKSKPNSSEREAVSELTTERLSIYLRCLTYLESQGVETVSSQELAKRFHLNSSQIRKDLACFGEFGIRGVGYNVTALKDQLLDRLGLRERRNVVICGGGNLGTALADYRGFNSGGFHIVGIFDSDPAKQGHSSRNGIPVYSPARLEEIVAENRVAIGIVAVPAEAAQIVFDRMVDAGICAVLNFAPVQLRRRGVKVRSVDLRINLEFLSFYLKNVEDGVCQADDETEESSV